MDALEVIENELKEKFGDIAPDILKTLLENPGINEEEIKKKVGRSLNTIRRVMYRMYKYGIVKFEREEVRRRWWVYKWKADLKRAVEFVLKEKEEKLRELVRVLEENEKYKFICPKCGKLFTYEDALFYGFTCNECNSLLLEYEKKVDNGISEEINELESKILELRKILEKL